jgi:hypothetical protein
MARLCVAGSVKSQRNNNTPPAGGTYVGHILDVPMAPSKGPTHKYVAEHADGVR